MSTSSEEIFVDMIIDEINQLKGVDTIKKQLSAYVIRYLLLSRTKTVKFRIMGLAHFCIIDPNLLLQPYDQFVPTTKRDKLFEIPHRNGVEISPNEYLSLLESTLRILMTQKINKSGIRMSVGPDGSVLVGEYAVLCKFIKPTIKSQYLHSDFLVEFSDEFWIDFLGCS